MCRVSLPALLLVPCVLACNPPHDGLAANDGGGLDRDAPSFPDAAPSPDAHMQLDAPVDAPPDALPDAADAPPTSALTIEPPSVLVPAGRTQSFVAAPGAAWTIDEGAAAGTIDANGRYVAPATAGTYHVRATLDGAEAVATVEVAAFDLEIVAGTTGGWGYREGKALEARMEEPYGIEVDSTGRLYFSDTWGTTLRTYDPVTQTVSTIAGKAYAWAYGGVDGVGAVVRLGDVRGLALDEKHHRLYFVDSPSIRFLDLASGQVTTLTGDQTPGLLDGDVATARFRDPVGLTFDGKHTLYVADGGNHAIRSLDLNTQTVSTVAGGTKGTADGTGTAAQFAFPQDVAFDAGTLYVGDYVNSRIRKIDLPSKAVTTIAGSVSGNADGPASTARFSYPIGVTPDHAGSLYIADAAGRVRKLDLATNIVSTVAGGAIDPGQNGIGTNAGFPDLYELAYYNGTLYVPDRTMTGIRQITLADSNVTDLVGDRRDEACVDGPVATARFIVPAGIVFQGDKIVMPDMLCHTVRAYDAATQTVSTYAGAGGMGTNDGTYASAKFRYAFLALDDGAGGFYMNDSAARTIRHLANGSVSTVWGNPDYGVVMDGYGTGAWFGAYAPAMVRVGSKIFVPDGAAIRMLDTTSLQVSTPIGSTQTGYVNGPGAAARFGMINGLASDGSRLYVTDTGNYSLRVVDLTSPTYDVTTLPLTDSTGVPFQAFGALFYGPDGFLYLHNSTVLYRVWPATGKVDAFLGSPNIWAAFPGPFSTASLHNRRLVVAFDPDGTMYLTQEQALMRVTHTP